MENNTKKTAADQNTDTADQNENDDDQNTDTAKKEYPKTTTKGSQILKERKVTFN